MLDPSLRTNAIDRPERRVLSFLDSPVEQKVSTHIELLGLLLHCDSELPQSPGEAISSDDLPSPAVGFPVEMGQKLSHFGTWGT